MSGIIPFLSIRHVAEFSLFSSPDFVNSTRCYATCFQKFFEKRSFESSSRGRDNSRLVVVKTRERESHAAKKLISQVGLLSVYAFLSLSREERHDRSSIFQNESLRSLGTTYHHGCPYISRKSPSSPRIREYLPPRRRLSRPNRVEMGP